jgi:hypothetical protein
LSIVPARRQENSVTAPSIVLLTEEALTTADAERLARLHADEEVQYLVLVPADVERNLLVDVLDHLSLLQLREALEAVRGEEEPTRAEAAKALTESLVALTAAGITADGYVVEGDPVTALQKAVSSEVQEVIVVTRPHAVEDTFHTDWASKARELLGVPVLHVYAGSSHLG